MIFGFRRNLIIWSLFGLGGQFCLEVQGLPNPSHPKMIRFSPQVSRKPTLKSVPSRQRETHPWVPCKRTLIYSPNPNLCANPCEWQTPVLFVKEKTNVNHWAHCLETQATIVRPSSLSPFRRPRRDLSPTESMPPRIMATTSRKGARGQAAGVRKRKKQNGMKQKPGVIFYLSSLSWVQLELEKNDILFLVLEFGMWHGSFGNVLQPTRRDPLA